MIEKFRESHSFGSKFKFETVFAVKPFEEFRFETRQGLESQKEASSRIVKILKGIETLPCEVVFQAEVNRGKILEFEGFIHYYNESTLREFEYIISRLTTEFKFFASAHKKSTLVMSCAQNIYITEARSQYCH